ncbi:hypothetical protein SCG7109_AA_00180 [Chlamydiales bacterium SCGC AG-110-M15]|nr:hypothetical protein SCG7109_AA_00180 [Chlamydiales bacterium SCGC AG-110-M15]
MSNGIAFFCLSISFCILKAFGKELKPGLGSNPGLNPVCYLIQPLSLRKIVRCNEDSAGHSFSYGQAV